MTSANLDDYAWLVGDEGARWLAELAESPRAVHQQITWLRKHLSADRARLLVEQAELRKRAAGKFGSWAEYLFFTDVGLQQATDRWIGRYKATRFPEGATVHDFGCGIGGDLLGLAGRGPVVGWERTAEVALLAQANVRALLAARNELCSPIGAELVEVRTADVEDQPPEKSLLQPGEYWHLDPDRRAGGT